jgi:diguanylate cyclase (GGDEF)-like protein
MVSGLSWARQYTGMYTVATLLAFLWTQPSALTNWTGWLQMATFGLTPWLLDAQRVRERLLLKRLHAEEAAQMTHLSEAARSLLSVQASTQQMEAQIAEITDLYHVTKETARALHLTELFTASLNIAPRFLNARGLRLIDLSGATPQIFRASRATDGRMVASDTNHLLEMEQAIIKEAVSSGQPSSATAQELSCPLPEGISRVSWAPLWREQQPIGVLVADELPERQLKTLSIVANQLSLQFSRISLYQQVEALAVTDALTGLFVRGHFMERAREELARSTRHGLPCTLLMTDLDLFKQKNDTFGHLVGDVVLRDVARLLSRNLREIDMIARYGGEEFILLLIETHVEQAMPIAQRLKQLVEVHPIRAYDELLTQTISIGVAGFPDHAQTLEALIERADQALYAAKRAGRNRVVRWSENLMSV